MAADTTVSKAPKPVFGGNKGILFSMAIKTRSLKYDAFWVDNFS